MYELLRECANYLMIKYANMQECKEKKREAKNRLLSSSLSPFSVICDLRIS